MLKGHAKIELINIETGDTQVIEHDNLVTKGLEHFLQYKLLGAKNILTSLTNESGGYAYRYNTLGYNTIKTELFGGLFLFEDAQEENENNYLINTANRIIGKGGITAYTGTDTLLGSYNLNDSGWQEDGSMKYVWEFNPSQANGRISSLSLVPLYMATLGYGTPDRVGPENINGNRGFLKFSNRNYVYNSSVTREYPAILIDGRIKNKPWDSYTIPTREFIAFVNPKTNSIGITYRPNIIYLNAYKQHFFVNTKKLLFQLIKVPLSSAGYFNDINNLVLIENDIEVDVPDKFLEGLVAEKTCCAWYYDSGYVYFLANNSTKKMLPAEETFKLLRIDTRNGYQTTVLEIVNTTGERIYLASDETNESYGMEAARSRLFNGGGINVYKNYILALGESGKYYRLNINDSTDVRPIMMNGVEFVSNKRAARIRIEGLFICYDDYMINIDTCEVLYCGSDSFKPCYYGGDALLYDEGMLYTVYRETIYIDSKQILFISARCAYSPYVLMTINNLPSPVTKTASQSMRVTYTISQAPDDPTQQ